MAMLPIVCVLAMVAPVHALVIGKSNASQTPVEKVLDMLIEMKTKGGTMSAAEQETYAAYKEWVYDLEKQLEFEISTAKRDIEELEAFIGKANSDASLTSAAIEKRNGEIASLEAEKQGITDVRGKEYAEYTALEADYSESVDALERAIQMLEAESYDRPQAVMMMQKMRKTVPGMSRVLAAFMQEQASQRSDGAPAVAAYEFQSGGVVGILKKLLEEFKTELSETTTEETNKEHYFQLEAMHLSDAIAKTTSDVGHLEAMLAETKGASVQAQGELTSTEANLAKDEKFLAETQSTFAAKTDTFHANQEVRATELDAIHKAIEIISSPEVAASYAKHVNLAQLPGSPASFLQTRGTTNRRQLAQLATELLNNESKALSSDRLATLAQDLTTKPFDKVIGMVEDLLSKLKEEAAAEADHKKWCDDELKNNEEKRTTKSAAVDDLNAQIETSSAKIAEMANKIATLSKEQQQLASDVAEATQQRTSEKAQNGATVADAQAGIAAVRQALEILQEYYSKQAALVQVHQTPEMEEYKGMHGEKTGVIGMLEVIETDLSRLEAETTSAEQLAATAYKEFIVQAEADIKDKHKQEFNEKLAKDKEEFEMSLDQKDLAAVSEELAKANKYYQELKPACVEIHVSYEERVAKREEEIEALKQAYDVLDQKSA